VRFPFLPPYLALALTCAFPTPLVSFPPAAEIARRHQLQFPEHGAVSLRHLAVPADVAVARPGQPTAFFPAFDEDRIIGEGRAEEWG